MGTVRLKLGKSEVERLMDDAIERLRVLSCDLEETTAMIVSLELELAALSPLGDQGDPRRLTLVGGAR